MIPDTDRTLRIAELRNKIRNGGTLTLEESREAITFLRAGRAAVAQATSGTKARKTAATKTPAPSSDDLLSELDNL